ncbi:MAG: hypothetical protein WCJ35_16930 [Planctomycetota bacterium]
MNGQRSSFRIRSWMALMFLMTATLLSAAGCLSSSDSHRTSGGLADLIPGHKEAALRKRVESDSFPSANQAPHAPLVGEKNGSE